MQPHIFCCVCFATRVCVSVLSHLIMVTLHVGAVWLCSTPLSLLRSCEKQAGHAGNRTHLVTAVPTKGAVMCSPLVACHWVSFIHLFIFSVSLFQTLGGTFSPSQAPARSRPCELQKRDAWMLCLFVDTSLSSVTLLMFSG